jgi:hypothetical protein
MTGRALLIAGSLFATPLAAQFPAPGATSPVPTVADLATLLALTCSSTSFCPAGSSLKCLNQQRVLEDTKEVYQCFDPGTGFAWTLVGDGKGAPAGAEAEIQFNTSGAFDGDSGLTFTAASVSGSDNTLTINGATGQAADVFEVFSENSNLRFSADDTSVMITPSATDADGTEIDFREASCAGCETGDVAMHLVDPSNSLGICRFDTLCALLVDTSGFEVLFGNANESNLTGASVTVVPRATSDRAIHVTAGAGHTAELIRGTVNAVEVFAVEASGQTKAAYVTFAPAALPACPGSGDNSLAIDASGDLCHCDSTSWNLVSGGGSCV